jgi:hypothetical protein
MKFARPASRVAAARDAKDASTRAKTYSAYFGTLLR